MLKPCQIGLIRIKTNDDAFNQEYLLGLKRSLKLVSGDKYYKDMFKDLIRIEMYGK